MTVDVWTYTDPATGGPGEFRRRHDGVWEQRALGEPTVSTFAGDGPHFAYVELVGINPAGLVFRLYADHCEARRPGEETFTYICPGRWGE